MVSLLLAAMHIVMHSSTPSHYSPPKCVSIQPSLYSASVDFSSSRNYAKEALASSFQAEWYFVSTRTNSTWIKAASGVS